jgi:hypothetical protein
MRTVKKKRKSGRAQMQKCGLEDILGQIEYFIVRLLLIGLLLIAAYDLVAKQVQLSRLCH